ncbi:FABP family protein [Gordonia sp. HY002]|uniref:FABP family protein n=1 Tax=Gordonia zhenghanii TaxID=2911516 RepID=UPI001EEFD13C|nr:FABP family protein [Gordonia zhenghanii]MCF8568913.1 FABP family protein [Gordonia zhenghanii]MCF8603008.1 FABP family protein [Gordonia zhenghanii]MCF8603079.1 FABP family protein [Gordonia zhenghanii]
MTRSGNEAISDAELRAQETAGRNVPVIGDVPLPVDTANLREGPDLSPALLALLPMVGVWEGEGEGHDPISGDDYQFGQQIVVSHDGGDYLVWQSRSWKVDDDGAYVSPDLRESGFWRISEDDDIELLLTHAEGVIELFYGRPLNQTSWNLTTDVTLRTETGVHTGGAKRLYGLVPDGDLAYVEERVDADGELTPRLSAKLRRVIG